MRIEITDWETAPSKLHEQCTINGWKVAVPLLATKAERDKELCEQLRLYLKTV